jgi:hypothetical protein
MVNQRLKPNVLRAAVKRMYELGLKEPTILKIFSVYPSMAIVETLKHYKYVSVQIPEEFFLKKIQDKACWEFKVDRRLILLKAMTEIIEGMPG